MTSPRQQARDERERRAAERIAATALILYVLCMIAVGAAGIMLGWLAARYEERAAPPAPNPVYLIQT
ncbi:hypothetical protein [Pseudofrankia sp. DC12]|uniref:hypothetical protein n=1 Tax=Pseudofrankia sp. DC12 TaxID=683315 RepID=UPI0005F81961|nr:hypothetical protein [Pseudofrankia sp. DC12]